ncbi:hypothetical protein BB561_000997 [Smittium simulii]|uniref:acetyl-CoA C-acetyltransferase n=1 Tax=Smittium simulii TaxID=133385 RepID=A0A2T9YWL5_9FUNG|nr:hypothetical protein BB561_000997 [Smittium simulii]
MNVFLVSAVRTPIGSFMGSLKSLSATKLGAVAIKGALDKAKISGEQVNEVYMGQVLQGGQGQAPASQAAFDADIPTSVPCTTINKVCASGMKAIMLGSQTIQLGLADTIVAGGMESMSNAPFLVPRTLGFGNQSLKDSLVLDGLTNVGNEWLMGKCTEQVVAKHNITRQQQDEYAISTYQRTLSAIAEKRFSDEIVSVQVPGKKGNHTEFMADEEPFKVDFDRIPSLRAVFDKPGTITAANASKLSDGASAVVLVSKNKLDSCSSLKPLARVVSFADANTDPIEFAAAPALAIPIALQRANLALKDIAKWELNEAFSAVPLLANKILDIPLDKINVNGGSVALGHPLGSSGSRIVVTLIHSLKPGEFGCAAICNGGGGASAIVIQRL